MQHWQIPLFTNGLPLVTLTEGVTKRFPALAIATILGAAYYWPLLDLGSAPKVLRHLSWLYMLLPRSRFCFVIFFKVALNSTPLGFLKSFQVLLAVVSFIFSIVLVPEQFQKNFVSLLV